MQVVLNVEGSSRTTGRGHNREVVTLYRWPLVQVPLYHIKLIIGNLRSLVAYNYSSIINFS